MKKIVYFLIVCIVSVFFLSGCESETDPFAITVKEAVYDNNSMKLTLADNTTLQLTPFTMPRKDGIQVTYSNRHPEWLSVSSTGLLQPADFGGQYDPTSRTDTLTITANGVSTNYVVVITNHIKRLTAINVTSAGSNVSLKMGRTFDLAACLSFVPTDAYNKNVTYESSDESIATVSAAGLITSVAVGEAVITIRSTDGSNIVKTCNVSVVGLANVPLDRTGWTAVTAPALEPSTAGFNYIPVGISWIPDKVVVNGVRTLVGSPADMFDDEPLTYFCLEKPGKGAYTCVSSASGWNGTNADYGAMLDELITSVGGSTTVGTSANPTNSVVNYFVIDTKKVNTFSFLIWRHRNAANNRVLTIDLYGSNDATVYTGDDATVGTKWTKLNVTPVDLSEKSNNDEMNIFITPAHDEFSYQYLKVVCLTYPSSGMTFGVAEFGLGIVE
jgi:hypothetical protein